MDRNALLCTSFIVILAIFSPSVFCQNISDVSVNFHDVRLIHHHSPLNRILNVMRRHCECFELLGCIESIFFLCPQTPEQIDTKFFIFDSLSNSSTHDMDTIRATDRIVIVVHGYESNSEVDYYILLRDALKTVVDKVIMVDYRKGADPQLDDSRISEIRKYIVAALNGQLVGRQIGNYIRSMIMKRSVHPLNVHMIGYSLGAEVVHFAAEWLSYWDIKIARITGLDPAGPLFTSYPNRHLTTKDANFVDIIHSTRYSWHITDTINGLVGLPISVGHVDFWPNGGGYVNKKQPGCENDPDGWCSHRHGIEFYISSIYKCQYPAFPCADLQHFISGQCEPADTQMGYHSIEYKARGDRYLNTSANPLATC